MRVALSLALACSVLAGTAGWAHALGNFVTFETGPTRPLAISPDGTRLFAVNTPDGRLEIFDVGPAGLSRRGSVPVGLEPVAVAARTDAEVWVVNHLSDSVSQPYRLKPTQCIEVSEPPSGFWPPVATEDAIYLPDCYHAVFRLSPDSLAVRCASLVSGRPPSL